MDTKNVLWTEILKHEGINSQDLPEKTQKKIKQYNDIVNSTKIMYRKYNKKDGTSELTVKAKDELENLNELIITHIAEFMNDKEEAERLAKEEAERLAKEEAERLAKEKEEEEKRKQTNENGNVGREDQQDDQENQNGNDNGEEDEGEDGPFGIFGF
jgi:hypothetical protein